MGTGTRGVHGHANDNQLDDNDNLFTTSGQYSTLQDGIGVHRCVSQIIWDIQAIFGTFYGHKKRRHGAVRKEARREENNNPIDGDL